VGDYRVVNVGTLVTWSVGDACNVVFSHYCGHTAGLMKYLPTLIMVILITGTLV